MSAIITSITHPYWGALGARASARRSELRLSQARVASLLKLSVREYAALESGFIPPEIADALGRVSLATFDDVLDWDKGTARSFVEKALTAAMRPTASPAIPRFADETSVVSDRSAYPSAAWVRLGKAVQAARMTEKLSRNELAYAMKSSSKTIMRLEEGRIYGDPRTAPPGDYNSERYILRRLAFLEMYLGWERGWAAQILEGSAASSAA